VPFRFVCSKCGATLLECGEEILRYQTIRNTSKNTLATPIEVFISHKIGGTCPVCGRKLSAKPVKVDVYPNPATRHKLPFVSSLKRDYHKRRR